MARRKQAWSGWGAPAMKRVAGWDFDHRLNGYITTAADRFSCDCGEEFATPSGYRKCGSCGRAWNSYVIGSDGHGKEAALEKVIVREIPVRKDVIVASKRRQAHRRKAESGYNARRQEARRYVAWCRQVGRMPSTTGLHRFLTAERMVRLADRHTLRRIDLQEQEPEPEQDTVSIEHFSSRRRAELFDITEEGETPKGKGKKSNTPTMRKNPDIWTKHKQNGQFSKRWN